jgi:hyperosmotically inducible protein
MRFLAIVACAVTLIGTSAAPGAAGVAWARDATADQAQPTRGISNAAITATVKARLAAEHVRTLAHVHVDTDAEGVVWLRGTVTSAAMADRAVAIVRDTDGVSDVHSDLRVVRPTS